MTNLVRAVVGASILLVAGEAEAQSTSPVGLWSGPYAGLNAGYIPNGNTRFDRTMGDLANNQAALNNNLRPTQHNVKAKGFIGGAQVGYNYALPSRNGDGLVVGAEADVEYTGLKRKDLLSNTTNFGGGVTPSTTPVTRNNEYRSNLSYLGTVRGRVGYAFDQVILYGTGGLAFGHVKRSATFYGPNLPTTPFFTGSSNGTKVGYSIGGGIEVALPNQPISVRAEYLRYDLGRDRLRLNGVNGGATIGGYDARVRTSGSLIRAAINYRL